MNDEFTSEQLEQVRAWLRDAMPRLRRTGIDDIADLLTQTPLGFMTSQAFLMVRPLFNGVRGIEVYDSLARLLSTPEGTEWLRAEIASLQEKGFGR